MDAALGLVPAQALKAQHAADKRKERIVPAPAHIQAGMDL
jgi:hypothetical protein